MSRKLMIVSVGILFVLPAWGQISDPDLNDIPAKIVPEQSHYDYEKRVVEIPMRDGVKIIPKRAKSSKVELVKPKRIALSA